MLSETLKAEIQDAYSRLLTNKGFKARHCQKLMVAEIARTLSHQLDPGAEEGETREVTEAVPGEGNICVVEAGTGTGKTIAYAIAAMPMAKALGKKVVISTATVALQEQIVYQDLPDIREHSGLDFSFTLAKGRGRYLCLSRLDKALQNPASMNYQLELSDDRDSEHQVLEQSDRRIYESMLNDLDKEAWDGDRDNWPTELDPDTWQRVSTDHIQCTGKQCSHYDNCCFYRARENIHRVECIVANHDLVLADLLKGGGAVLPVPGDTIYIFDEGHHLPEKASSHLSHFIHIQSTRVWLEQIVSTLKLVSAEQDTVTPAMIAQVEQFVSDAKQLLDAATRMFEGLYASAQQESDGRRYRFPLGVVDENIASLCEQLLQAFSRLLRPLEALAEVLGNNLDNAEPSAREIEEHWLSVVSAIVDRISGACGLWHSYASSDRKVDLITDEKADTKRGTGGEDEAQPPFARWVDFKSGGAVEGMEIHLSSSPISVANELQEHFWSRCAGAVITSATLSVGRDFTNFRQRSGISAANTFVSLPSPFNFPEQGTLHIPMMPVDPGMVEEHDRSVTDMIPKLLDDEPGSLVLFTSWRQMLSVMDALDADFRQRVLCQGSFSKVEIITRHRESVDAGEPSCIFGLASFAEGIDLPGHYCRHVVLVKIPFSVPDNPIAATLSEWIEERGGNPFKEIMLPEAALRMVQASGRLLRTETDTGRVTVLDRRLLTKWYGKLLLKALPPFKRETHSPAA